MAVKLFDKKKATKDGRKWIFYDWVTQLDGSRKNTFQRNMPAEKKL